MKNNMSSVPESDSAFSFERTKRLKGMLILGVFIFHFCNFFPTEVRPDIGHTMVGAFFMLSGFGLLESFKRKKNYLDGFVGKKTARLLVPVWIAGIIVLIVNWTVYNNHLVLTENAYLYDVISGGVTTTGTWFVVELIILYLFFYLAFKYLKMKWAIVAVSLATFLLMVILSPQKYGMWYASGMMFPVGLIISYWKDKIESFVPHLILAISIIVSIILALSMENLRMTSFSNLLFGNLQCLFVSLFIIASLLTRKTGFKIWILTLLLCNVAYFLLGTMLQLGPNLITAMPVITALLIPAGTDIISPLTNFFGNISYEFYIIHVTMLYVSRIWFTEMLSCFMSSLILALIVAIIINKVTKVFIDDKKKDASLKSGRLLE